MVADDLADELAVYEKEKDRLISAKYVGNFVVIGKGEVIGVWDTYRDALKSGYEKFGLDTRFLVKKIEAIEGIQFFTRNIAGCRV